MMVVISVSKAVLYYSNLAHHLKLVNQTFIVSFHRFTPTFALPGITCSPDFSNPSNGRVKCSDFSNFGSKCTFRCDDGFSLQGSQVTRCTKDGWSNTRAPSCKSKPWLCDIKSCICDIKSCLCDITSCICATCICVWSYLQLRWGCLVWLLPHWLVDLLFHMTQLINRNNTKSSRAAREPIVSEH